MLSVEANERLTRVGPGTPMGTLMRRYWQPIRPLAQLLDEDVMKVRILGEDLVLFRSLKGELGLIGANCAHRRTGLEFGIPDERGLRCCYHGWLYDTSGQCIEQPLEAPDSTFKDRVQITGYPVQELGGLVWAYLGPAPAPLLPPWDLLVMPNALRQIGVVVLDCNWLQCHENTGDPAHSVYLHGHLFEYVLKKQGKLEERAAEGGIHTLYSRIKSGIGIESLFARATPHGMEKGINYTKALGADRDFTSRHSTVIFPFITQTGGAGQVRQEFQIRVPIDDTHTYHINYGCYLAPPDVEAPAQDVVPWYDVPLFDADGRPILDYVLAQDMTAWRSQGTITDRSLEKLGRTDQPIIFLRRQLEEQLGIVEDGGDPMNVFRDPTELPEVLHGGAWDESVAAWWTENKAKGTGTGSSDFRSAYHKGHTMDDVDRYGPVTPQVVELMREIAEAQSKAAG